MIDFLNKRKQLRCLLMFAAFVAILYGIGRLYYAMTDGFLVSNITYDLPYDARWEIPSLLPEEKQSLKVALNQPYHYLGKGCQSYVFASEDGQYVLKFFKYQRLLPQEWLRYFSFIPFMEQYRLAKIKKKKKKLENVLTSWKIAYEYLQPETGVVYIHLNKSSIFEHELLIYDKMGFKHQIDLNTVEFLLQKRAEMLCPTLENLMAQGNQTKAEAILANLVRMLVFENSRGFADNDHALMQNTGVLAEQPVHIDVGQFIRNPIVKDPEVYQQEIFNKTYKFRLWLRKQYPILADYLDRQLEEVIGEKFWDMKPIFYTADMARIPNA